MIKGINCNKEFVTKYLDVILLWLIPFLVYVPLGSCIKNGLKENILIPMEAGYVILIIADVLIDFYLKHEKISLRDGIAMDIIRRFIIYIGSYNANRNCSNVYMINIIQFIKRGVYWPFV